MSQSLTLLKIPVEIRLKIYDFVLISNNPVRIIAQEAVNTGEEESWELHRNPLSSQLLRTSQQVYDETRPRLYSLNAFDCSSREGLKLLLHNIGPINCSLIKTIVLDWEQLQDFAWSLAKEEYVTATRGLESVRSAHWRQRIMGGSSLQWRSVKSYERQLCQAALDICNKHPNLKVLAQQLYHKTSRVQGASVTTRVKWRFVKSTEDLNTDETVVDIGADLAKLQATKDETAASSEPGMIDPF